MHNSLSLTALKVINLIIWVHYLASVHITGNEQLRRFTRYATSCKGYLRNRSVAIRPVRRAFLIASQPPKTSTKTAKKINGWNITEKEHYNTLSHYESNEQFYSALTLRKSALSIIIKNYMPHRLMTQSSVVYNWD